MKEKELIRLISAAQMYYEENMTQAEIAKSMGISRPSVSNLLNKAAKKVLLKLRSNLLIAPALEKAGNCVTGLA